MPRSLKLVPEGATADAEPVTMAAALADLLTALVAQQPCTVLLMWELPGGSALQIASLPGSLALTQGMVRAAYRQLWPEEFEAADA